MQVVSSIVRKKFITEMDLLRLQKALLMCRLAADGTAFVDKQFPGFSSKMEKLDELLGQLAREEGRRHPVILIPLTARGDSLQGIDAFPVEADDGPMNDTATIIDQFNAAFRDRAPEKLVDIIGEDCLMEGTGPAPDGNIWRGYDECLAGWQGPG